MKSLTKREVLSKLEKSSSLEPFNPEKVKVSKRRINDYMSRSYRQFIHNLGVSDINAKHIYVNI